jgi:adenylate cyclase
MAAKNETSENTHATAGLPMPAIRIQEQIQRILASPAFRATDAQKAFLDFVMKKTLAGESEEIKGYTVATRVFGRREDFDQATDPIVSIQANKLRRALEHYYLTAGKKDPIRIEIPKGGYVPVFSEFNTNSTPVTTNKTILHGAATQFTWPTVLVRPFKNLTGDGERDYFGTGFATELSIALSRFQDIRVLLYLPEGKTRRVSDSHARFIMEGSVRRHDAKIFVNVQLIDSESNIQIFGESNCIESDPSRISEFREEMIEKIATAIAGEHGAISRVMSKKLNNKPPKELTTYEAILRYYAYDKLLTPETYITALEALTHASKKEPDCGQVWTKLARLHADNFALELFDTDITIDQVLAFATKGALFNPDSQRARVVLGFVRMLRDELPAALTELERALALNPCSLFFMDVIGYILTLVGEWERGPELIKKAMTLNPYYHNHVHYGLWLSLFRRKEYEQAFLESMNLAFHRNYWEPLTRAAALGKLGRIEEGKLAANELLIYKADFQKRGRKLIKNYIKFDDLIEQIIDGLGNVGVTVD